MKFKAKAIIEDIFETEMRGANNFKVRGVKLNSFCFKFHIIIRFLSLFLNFFISFFIISRVSSDKLGRR